MIKLPIDNKDGLIITISVTRKGEGKDVQHFMGDSHIESLNQLKNIVSRGVELLWESHDIKSI